MKKLGEAAVLHRNGIGAFTVLRMLTIQRGATVIDGRRVSVPDDASEVMWRTREIFGRTYDLPGFEIRRGDSVVDVGANIGLFALLAIHLGARTVAAFEPHPQTARWLTENTAGLPVTVHQAAVTPSGGTASLWLSRDSDTRHSTAVPQQSGSPSDSPLEVPAVTLLEAIGEGCDVLKLDCEGEEFAVIQATPPEKLRRVRTIIGELHEYAGATAEMSRALEAAGFEFLRYPRPGYPLSMFLACRR